MRTGDIVGGSPQTASTHLATLSGGGPLDPLERTYGAYGARHRVLRLLDDVAGVMGLRLQACVPY